MKKLNVVLLAGLLSLGSIAGLASCGPTTRPTEAPTSAPTEAPTTQAPTETPTETPTEAPTTAPAKVAQRFETVQMDGPILVGESVDLAEKITVIYQDGTKDHDFTVKEGDGYVIAGSIVTFEVGGDYNLLIEAHGKSMRYKVKVETQDRRDFNAFIDSIEKNYTVYNVSMSETNQLEIGGFAYHGGDEYYAMYFGANLNHIYAKLSDGVHYAGNITEVRTITDFDFKFNPGAVNWQNLYAFQNLQDGISSSLFESEFADDGTETIVASADIAETFLNYSVSLTYGGDAMSMEFAGWLDDEKSSALFALAVNDEGETVYDLWVIEAVNTTSIEIIEDYQVNGELPSAVPTENIDSIVESMHLASNYTMEFSTSFLTSTGAEATEEQVTEWGEAGKFSGSQTTHVTEDTVSVSVGGEPVIGFTTVDEQLYQFGYTSEGTPAMTAAEGTLATNAAAGSLMAPTASVDDLEFASYEERTVGERNLEIFGSDAGSRVWSFDGANVGDELSSTGAFVEQLLTSVLNCAAVYEGMSLVELYYYAPFVTFNGETGKIHSASSILDVQYMVVDSTYQLSVSIMADIAWMFGNQLDMKSIRFVSYNFTFYSIGTTVAPDLSVFTSTLA